MVKKTFSFFSRCRQKIMGKIVAERLKELV
ncbi:uncharacterized protein METZ01_LOCUS168111 [marine metagenome]|uniref:Uncharacterized protein n=1 Tax=marine metagenome TaxID=408172 RepID=A0A382BQ26_9ZZZZ